MGRRDRERQIAREARQETPRAPRNRSDIRDRERSYSLSPTDLQVMRTVGTFRTMRREDVGNPASLQALQKQGLVRLQTVHHRREEEPLRVVALTREGKRFLEAHQPEAEAQRYWSGVVKPREVAHDAGVYRAVEAERSEIEADGGHVQRIVLDYEMKEAAYQDLNRAGGDESAEDRKRRIAAEQDLPLSDEGKLMFPDARIEYIDQEGNLRHLDVEVVTRHYSRSQIAAKSGAGFRCHSNKDGRREKPHENYAEPII